MLITKQNQVCRNGLKCILVGPSYCASQFFHVTCSTLCVQLGNHNVTATVTKAFIIRPLLLDRLCLTELNSGAALS